MKWFKKNIERAHPSQILLKQEGKSYVLTAKGYERFVFVDKISLDDFMEELNKQYKAL